MFGVTYIDLTALVEWLAIGWFCDDVPSPLVKLMVNAGFHIAWLCPAFLKLDVDTRTVAAVLWVVLVCV